VGDLPALAPLIGPAVREPVLLRPDVGRVVFLVRGVNDLLDRGCTLRQKDLDGLFREAFGALVEAVGNSSGAMSSRIARAGIVVSPPHNHKICSSSNHNTPLAATPFARHPLLKSVLDPLPLARRPENRCGEFFRRNEPWPTSKISSC